MRSPDQRRSPIRSRCVSMTLAWKAGRWIDLRIKPGTTRSAPTQPFGPATCRDGISPKDACAAASCAVPRCDGGFSREQEDALWQAYSTAAPARRRAFEPNLLC
ncbi:hypothetical protein GCM10009416_34440 [Craurococcus roseus]|uniref:Uncharacterized protein n=1 Tax=Craurococcus roseus TaxID=77585 RepID=A0ABP3QTB2_9PROT